MGTPAHHGDKTHGDGGARACTAWFRMLARAMKTARLYRPENPLVQQARSKVVEDLLANVGEHGGWRLSFTPSEIRLDGEPVVAPKAPRGSGGASFSSAEETMPFLFHRDGIRSIVIGPWLTHAEAESLFDALVLGCTEKPSAEDLVTLLWQANLENVEVESMPLDQAIYLSESEIMVEERAQTGSPAAGTRPSGVEMRASLGQAGGIQGLHRDPFDDWPMPTTSVDVPQAFERLAATIEPSLERARSSWRTECQGDWDRFVPQVFRAILALDPASDVRTPLAQSVATWLAATLDQHLLDRAALAYELLHEVDADLSRGAETLARALEKVDAGELAGYLDEADAVEQGRFAGLMVRLDAVATPLTFLIMKHATRSRTRAAAATALCYQCAEAPERLQPYVDDPQADVVLNLVFVLGQIGGPGVIEMLKFAAQHPDPRVRRQAVLSMGGAPERERVPALLDGLARLDPHILGTTLSMLARRQDEQVWRFILGLIEDPEFEHRGDDVQRALFNALAEVAEDTVVPALERMLHRGGGGFVRKRTFTQLAAAMALKRIGTPAARAVLEAGISSKHAAVRSACGDVLQRNAA